MMREQQRQPQNEPKYPVQTVVKAIEIINYLAADTSSRGVGVSELSRALGLGKSTVHRILDTLFFYGYIVKDQETNCYHLGWELYKISQVIPLQNQLFTIDRNILVELNTQVQETVNLGTQQHNKTIIISKVTGSTGTHTNINPREYESVHATALGKIMISELSPEQIKGLLNNKTTLPAYTSNTITKVDKLFKEINTIKQRGYAIDAEELCLGLYCIAMPIRDYTGKIVAAISVSSSSTNMNDKKKQLILKCLEEAATKASKKLGYTF